MSLASDRVERAVLGARRGRRVALAVLAVVLVGQSVAFLAGWTPGFLPVLVALVVAVCAGALGSGLVVTVGAAWTVLLWMYTFPPLVGLLSGEWGPASRYGYPQTAGFAYGSARAELVGGVEWAVGGAVPVAVVLAVVGYAVGAGLRSAGVRVVAYAGRA
jgi:hypothetical protein